MRPDPVVFLPPTFNDFLRFREVPRPEQKILLTPSAFYHIATNFSIGSVFGLRSSIWKYAG